MKVKKNGVVIGEVYQEDYGRLYGLWEYYCNLTGGGAGGIEQKQDAVLALRQDHEEALRNKLTQLCELAKEVKNYI
jgi:hypothetical protein